MHTLFFFISCLQKRTTYLGGDYEKRCRNERAEGRFMTWEPLCKGFEGDVHRIKRTNLNWKCVFLLFNGRSKAFEPSRTTALNLICKQMSKSSFPSIAFLSLSSFLVPMKCAYYAELFISFSCFLCRDFCLFHDFCLSTAKSVHQELREKPKICFDQKTHISLTKHWKMQLRQESLLEDCWACNIESWDRHFTVNISTKHSWTLFSMLWNVPMNYEQWICNLIANIQWSSDENFKVNSYAIKLKSGLIKCMKLFDVTEMSPKCYASRHIMHT